MVTFSLLIDTMAMIGSPASRGADPSVVCSGGARRGAASAGGAAVSAVRAAAAASVTIAGGAHRRTTLWVEPSYIDLSCPVVRRPRPNNARARAAAAGPLLLHDDRRADLDPVIEIDHVLIGHANAAR